MFGFAPTRRRAWSKDLLQADGGGTGVVDQPRRHHWGRPAPSVGGRHGAILGRSLRCSNGGASRHRRYLQVAICPPNPGASPHTLQADLPLIMPMQALRVSPFLRYSPRCFLGASWRCVSLGLSRLARRCSEPVALVASVILLPAPSLSTSIGLMLNSRCWTGYPPLTRQPLFLAQYGSPQQSP